MEREMERIDVTSETWDWTMQLSGQLAGEGAGECPCCRELAERDVDGMPVAEREQRLVEAEDWDGLIALRKRQLVRHPGEPHSILCLAEAYAAAGDHESSLAVAGDGYREHPDDLWLEDAVLAALLALGRSEHDYPWFGETPPVLRLDDRLMERVSELVAASQEELDEPSDPYLLYHALQDEAYLAFSPAELIAAIRSDPRFVVDDDPDAPWYPGVLPASNASVGRRGGVGQGDQGDQELGSRRRRCQR